LNVIPEQFTGKAHQHLLAAKQTLFCVNFDADSNKSKFVSDFRFGEKEMEEMVSFLKGLFDLDDVGHILTGKIVGTVNIFFYSQECKNKNFGADFFTTKWKNEREYCFLPHNCQKSQKLI
jgi:hypothetical protein